MISSQQDDDLATVPTGAVFGTPSIYRNVTAVDRRMSVARALLFDEIGGYDTRSLIASGDMILCLRATQLGYRNLYTPYAALIHHEGSTRGRSNPSDDILLLAKRFVNSIFKKIPSFIPNLILPQTTPAVRTTWAETSSAYLRRRIEEMTAFEPGRELTTLGSGWSARTALRNLPDHSSSARVAAEDVGRDIESATWFVIDLLRRDEGLARRFPLALSEARRFLQLALLRGDCPPWPARGAAQTICAASLPSPAIRSAG